MTFADLFAALETRGVLRRAAVKKSYLKTLATALGSSSLETCVVETAYLEEATWLGRLEDYFDARPQAGHPVSAYTRRNTKSELRSLFRLADQHGLLPAPLPPLLLKATTRQAFARELGKTSPYKHTGSAERYRLKQADWPPDIQAGWQAYRTLCGRRIRETTLAAYTTNLQTFFGYVCHVRNRPPAWEDLFDVVQLNAFVTWHGERMGQDVSAHGWHVVIGAAAMAKVLGHPRADEVLAFSRTVERPPVLHRKRLHHWVTTQAPRRDCQCLPRRRAPPVSLALQGAEPWRAWRHPLSARAHAQIVDPDPHALAQPPGDALRHESCAGPRGALALEFRGPQLKVAKRAGRANEYQFDLTLHYPPEHDDLLPTLEEYLTVYRPRLPNSTPDGFVFLTQLGTPYDGAGVHKELATIVARYTDGQRFYPHLIRTIWGQNIWTTTPAILRRWPRCSGTPSPWSSKPTTMSSPKPSRPKPVRGRARSLAGGLLTH